MIQKHRIITKGEDLSVLELFMVPQSNRLGIAQRLAAFSALRKERAELLKLTQQQLMDIGITPDQARKEAARAAWDVPENWSR